MADERARCACASVVPREALITAAEFAPRFDGLLLAGYAWINLSAYGLCAGDLIVDVELPRAPANVPAGLTSVNYSGPPLNAAGTPRWELALSSAEQLR